MTERCIRKSVVLPDQNKTWEREMIGCGRYQLVPPTCLTFSFFLFPWWSFSVSVFGDSAKIALKVNPLANHLQLTKESLYTCMDNEIYCCGILILTINFRLKDAGKMSHLCAEISFDCLCNIDAIYINGQELLTRVFGNHHSIVVFRIRISFDVLDRGLMWLRIFMAAHCLYQQSRITDIVNTTYINGQ